MLETNTVLKTLFEGPIELTYTYKLFQGKTQYTGLKPAGKWLLHGTLTTSHMSI